MKPITPAKRRLVVALAVAVKNYAKLQNEAEELFESAEHASIGGALVPGSVYKKVSELRAAAANSVYDAARDFDWSFGFVRLLRNAGVSEWVAYSRRYRLRAAFRRAVIKIAERGGYWGNDLLSEALERDSR